MHAQLNAAATPPIIIAYSYHCIASSPCSLELLPPKFIREMAGKELYTVEEVIDGLEGSDFEESEDDFEGYLDMDSGDDVCDEEQVECGEGEEQEAVVGLAMSEGDEGSERLDSIERLEPIPSYTLQPGCSEFVEGENPLDYFSPVYG